MTLLYAKCKINKSIILLSNLVSTEYFAKCNKERYVANCHIPFYAGGFLIMAGTFYGIGVGPGDPELLTMKAIKAIEKADVLFLHQKQKKKMVAWL